MPPQRDGLRLQTVSQSKPFLLQVALVMYFVTVARKAINTPVAPIAQSMASRRTLLMRRGWPNPVPCVPSDTWGIKQS